MADLSEPIRTIKHFCPKDKRNSDPPPKNRTQSSATFLGTDKLTYIFGILKNSDFEILHLRILILEFEHSKKSDQLICQSFLKTIKKF